MVLNYLSPASNVVVECYLPRRYIASSNKLYACTLVVSTFDHALLPVKNDDVARLIQISLHAYTAPAFGYLLPAEGTLVLRVVSRYGSRGAVASELRRLLRFAVTYIHILRIVELLEYAVVAAAFLEVKCLRPVPRFHTADAVGIVCVRLSDIEITSRTLSYGTVGDADFDTESFDPLVDVPLYGVHIRCGCRAFRRLQIPELSARLMVLRTVALLAY